jgi:AcrR family transcriptional regulator
MAVAGALRISRRERELNFRKEIILEAAEAVFADKGYYDAAVEEIAARAEISIGTLYNLFTSKEGLFLTVVQQRVNHFLQEITQRAEVGQTAAEKLDALLTGIFAYLEEHQAFFRLYVTTTHGLPWHLNSDMGALLFAKYREIQNFVTTICQQGKEEGLFHTESPFSLALAILGVANAFLTSWSMSKKKRPLSESLAEVRTYVRALIRGEDRNTR